MSQQEESIKRRNYLKSFLKELELRLATERNPNRAEEIKAQIRKINTELSSIENKLAIYVKKTEENIIDNELNTIEEQDMEYAYGNPIDILQMDPQTANHSQMSMTGQEFIVDRIREHEFEGVFPQQWIYARSQLDLVDKREVDRLVKNYTFAREDIDTLSFWLSLFLGIAIAEIVNAFVSIISGENATAQAVHITAATLLILVSIINWLQFSDKQSKIKDTKNEISNYVRTKEDT